MREQAGEEEIPAEELSRGPRRARWPIAVVVVVLVVCAAAAGFLATRHGTSHPAAATTPTVPAAATTVAFVPPPTTPPPPPEKITSCSRWDPDFETEYQTWYTSMNAPDATFASRASSTSLLTSEADDTSTSDTAVAGSSTVPDALDAMLIEKALFPLEDDLPLNQPTGTLPASYSTDVQAVVVAAAPFSAC